MLEPATFGLGSMFEHCARRWKVAVEFNCFPSRFDLPPELIRMAIDDGCWLAFGSDAHARAHLRHLTFGEVLAQQMNTKRF